jgi:hypothetical protein
MREFTFKWLVMGGSGLIVLFLSMAFLWKLTAQPQKSEKVAVVDIQSLLLKSLKGHSAQSDAELALRMNKLHTNIHQITRELSQETGTLILTKESLLSDAQDWTDLVRERLEQRS